MRNGKLIVKLLATFSRDGILWKHLEKFHPEASWSGDCPHPSWGATQQTSLELKHHLIDAHGLNTRELKTKSPEWHEPSKKRSKPEREADDLIWTMLLGSHDSKAKRHKATSMSPACTVIPKLSPAPTIASVESKCSQQIHEVGPERFVRREEYTLSESSTPTSSSATSINEWRDEWDEFFKFPPLPEFLPDTDPGSASSCDGQIAQITHMSLEDQEPAVSTEDAHEPLLLTSSQLLELGQTQKRCPDRLDPKVPTLASQCLKRLKRPSPYYTRMGGLNFGYYSFHLQCLSQKKFGQSAPPSRPAQDASIIILEQYLLLTTTDSSALPLSATEKASIVLLD